MIYFIIILKSSVYKLSTKVQNLHAFRFLYRKTIWMFISSLYQLYTNCIQKNRYEAGYLLQGLLNILLLLLYQFRWSLTVLIFQSMKLIKLSARIKVKLVRHTFIWTSFKCSLSNQIKFGLIQQSLEALKQNSNDCYY